MSKLGRSGVPLNPLNGLILTGGRSTRMGEDKSLLVYHDKPQRDHLTDLLRPFCDTVYWSVNAEQAIDLLQVNQPMIVDAFDVTGPLNGILSAFQRDPTAAWLVVACDMPLLTATSLKALITGRNPVKQATAFYDSDGRFPEPLLSIWEPSLGAIAKDAVAGGLYSPRQILMMNDVELLTAPDPRELLNVNDPAARLALKHRP